MAVDAMVAIAPILSGMLLALDRSRIPVAVLAFLAVGNRAGAGSVFTLTVPVCRQPEVVS